MSFRREKFVPRGGPDGGDGGDGGSVILECKDGKHSLVDFKYQQLIKAEHGVHGMGSNKTGKNGRDKFVIVPMGTVIKTYPDEKIMKDFSTEGERFTIVRGGRGGRGNTHFKSSVTRAPRRAESGQKGEVLRVVLELKLIAFAGLVGLPNAGKSTLISKISSARPKIADYPFTTLYPNLGVVYRDYDSLVIADIPGIIEGAHKGDGMGLEFLRHIERNTVLVLLIDLSDFRESPPLQTLTVLKNELKSYRSDLLKKKIFVVGNKTDLLDETGREASASLRQHCRDHGIAYLEISALKGINLEAFKNGLFEFYYSHG